MNAVDHETEKGLKHWYDLQGSTIGVRRVHTYAYFYWCTHDFGHAYVDMYAHFFPKIF